MMYAGDNLITSSFRQGFWPTIHCNYGGQRHIHNCCIRTYLPLGDVFRTEACCLAKLIFERRYVVATLLTSEEASLFYK